MELNKHLNFEQGIYIEYMTSFDRLSNLVNKLWPVKTKFPLIRIGSENDGGYLIPDDLDGIDACFSPGVDTNASFEQDLLTHKNINSHLADYSVDGPPLGFTPKSFSKKYLGALNDIIYMTLDKWVSEKTQLDHAKDLLLQMDIEGGEYTTILSASEETLKRFRIIVIEIHDVEAWGQSNFFSIVEVFFEKLLKNFHVVHCHPNNCCGTVNLRDFIAPRIFELTLLRKDRASDIGYCKTIPHDLDRPNLKEKMDLALPANWFFSKPAIPLDNIDYFLNEISGVIHVGANVGQESKLYSDLDLEVIWFEPIPEIFEELKFNISQYKNQIAYNFLLTDVDDQEYDFKISNNAGQSSSIFDLALHKELWPKVDYVYSIKKQSKTFASFIKTFNVNLDNYQALVLDTQGSELLILQGARSLLNQFRYIKTEVSDFESYIGCQRPEDIRDYLSQFGFKEIKRETFCRKSAVGAYYNILYGK
jgi:FkbM family methyltransferase